MKAKTVAATSFAAVLIIASCTWFAGKKKQAEKNLLAGRYELINVTDSPATKHWLHGDTIKWFFNSAKDSSHVYINFGGDSLFTSENVNGVDTSKYYAGTADKIVYIKEDSLYRPYTILRQSDSIINLFAANDSVYIALRKL
jgi:hypothetical protein